LPGKGASEKTRPSKPFHHSLAKAGPPLQRTRQMEKELEKTLLKRYEEAKALEKKQKKEKDIKKSNHEGCSPGWHSDNFSLHSFPFCMLFFPCANASCCL
jgi:hypothetical protein